MIEPTVISSITCVGSGSSSGTCHWQQPMPSDYSCTDSTRHRRRQVEGREDYYESRIRWVLGEY
jgi:hypothetical protein